MQIRCPWCGPRESTEFSCGGESHIARPPATVDDSGWASYLFFRDNQSGALPERWHHSYGCEQWFNVVRDTVTHEIVHVYHVTEPKPAQS